MADDVHDFYGNPLSEHRQVMRVLAEIRLALARIEERLPPSERTGEWESDAT